MAAAGVKDRRHQSLLKNKQHTSRAAAQQEAVVRGATTAPSLLSSNKKNTDTHSHNKSTSKQWPSSRLFHEPYPMILCCFYLIHPVIVVAWVHDEPLRVGVTQGVHQLRETGSAVVADGVTNGTGV